MKTTIKIVLTVLLVLQAGGLMIFYQGAQVVHKGKMATMLRGSMRGLEPMTLSIADYQKYKLDKDELRIGQKMYDIKRMEVVGDSIMMLVKNDSKEEQLQQRMAQLFGEDDIEDAFPQSLLDLLESAYLLPTAYKFLYFRFDNQQLYSPYNNPLPSYKTAVVYPPPRYS